MHHLSIYLFRQLSIAFVFAASAVSFVVLFTQLFRILSLVIDNSGTLMVFMHMLALSVPTFLPLVLPLGLGVATLFIYHRLAIDSELVVMHGAGISPLRIAIPAMLLGIIVFGLCMMLTLWLTPAANRALVSLQYKVRDSYAVFLSRPGSFNDIADGLTFYAAKRSSTGALEGILIHDVRRKDDPITIMADTGQVTKNDEGRPVIDIFSGRRQEMDMKTGRLSELAFDQYVLDLDALRSASPPRLPDPREQTIGELLHPSAQMLALRATPEHLMAEIHQRLASPFLALAYMMIGLAAILAGEFDRRGMSRRILIAALTIIVVQATFMSLNSVVVRHVWLALTLYVTALIPAATCLYLIVTESVKSRAMPVRTQGGRA